MQGKQAFISGAYRVVELRAPGHAGEHAKEVLQLCVRQGSVLVLPKYRESPGEAGPSPLPEGALPYRHLPAVEHHRDAANGRNRSTAVRPEPGELTEHVPQGLPALHNSKHALELQLQPGRTCPRLPHSPEHSWSQLSHSSLHQSSLAFHRQLSTQAAVPEGNLLAPGHPGMCIHPVLPFPMATELTWIHRDVCPLSAAIPESLPIVTELPYPRCTSTSE